MKVPETAMGAAMAKALRAKNAAVPQPVTRVVKKEHKEPDADEKGGPKDGDADDIRSTIKRAMR